MKALTIETIRDAFNECVRDERAETERFIAINNNDKTIAKDARRNCDLITTGMYAFLQKLVEIAN